MLSYIPSFYLLQRLTIEPWSRQAAARAAFESLADSMATCLRDYLFMACLGESRHAMGKIGSGFDGFNGKERDEVYKFSRKYAISPGNIKALVDIFDSPMWGKKPGYGGQKWRDLAVIVGQYDQLSRIMFVDAVVNAQHNGGTAFSKTDAMGHMDIDFTLDFSNLRGFLDFRRQSKDILNGFTNYFTRVSLSTGKLAIAHAAELHSPLGVEMLVPLPDHIYKPVKWGSADLPALVKTKRSCSHCHKYFLEYKKCPECGDIYCLECYGDQLQCKWCMSSGSYKLGRCPVCLQEMDEDNSYKANCGIRIHKSCSSEHRLRCPSCYPNMNTYKHNGDRCYYCGLPIIQGLEHWSDYQGHSIHQYCFHLHSEAPAGDYKSSKQLFDEIAYLCAICNKPILKGAEVHSVTCVHHEINAVYHDHCAMMHMVDCDTATLCGCAECSTEYKVWKKIKKEIDNVKKE